MRKLVVIFLLVSGSLNAQIINSYAFTVASELVELYSQDNAASIDTETDATTGWVTFGTTLEVAGVGKTDTQTAKIGSYSIKGTALDGSSDMVYYNFSATAGTSYTVSFSTLITRYSNQAIRLWTNCTGGPSIFLSSDGGSGWVDRSYTITANSTATCAFRFYAASSGVANDAIYIDNFSITEN